jgi:predicted amidophosphoribosyltransferase
LIVLVGTVLVYFLTSGQSWEHSSGDGTLSDRDEIVCPRCHHTTDPESTVCPECGKDLS